MSIQPERVSILDDNGPRSGQKSVITKLELQVDYYACLFPYCGRVHATDILHVNSRLQNRIETFLLV
jgi:hypothetical protein